MASDIRTTTMMRCVDAQLSAQAASDHAAISRDIRGWMDVSCRLQVEAAYHHEEMRIRLERLIGVN